jgi:hypothetical protein
MRGDKDDGDLYTCLSQSLLEVEAAHLRQSHIKHQATRPVHAFRTKEILTTCERFSAKANGLDKVMDRLTQTTVVVDDEYRGKRFRRHARASALVGRLKQKVAPGPILEVAQTRPPWASTIDRVIAKPIPVPCGFVVWNASKICSALSVGNPTPVSLIEMVN